MHSSTTTAPPLPAGNAAGPCENRMGGGKLLIYNVLCFIYGRTHGLRVLVAPLLLVVMAVVPDGKIAFDYYEKVSHTDIEALNNLAQCYN